MRFKLEARPVLPSPFPVRRLRTESASLSECFEAMVGEIIACTEVPLDVGTRWDLRLEVKRVDARHQD